MFEGQGQSSGSQEENVANGIGATSSESFLVLFVFQSLGVSVALF